jgi:N6-L-threonylcarbamoyladenine synthase
MKILAIETSCDDTCIAILDAKKSGKSVSFKILSNVIHSQIDVHREFGGVFPALAKREHIKNITPVYEKAMRDAKNPKIDAIAVTVGPGLEPALWVGITFAKELGEKLDAPIIPVNHMEGHVLSVFPQKGKTFTINSKKKIFPSLSLLVSGGHTELVLTKKWQDYKLIGQTVDDAAGEAFDKVARMLGLPYPGGPEISRLATEERKNIDLMDLAQASRGRAEQKNQQIFTRVQQSNVLSGPTFPRPMIHSKDYNFSFSGLKTAVLYYIRDHGPLTEKLKSQIAREFEDAAIEVLIKKTIRAIKQYKIKTLIVGGGVSANAYLRDSLKKACKKEKLKIDIHFPVKNLSTDNALMIAIAGYFRLTKNKKYKTPKGLEAIGNLAL